MISTPTMSAEQRDDFTSRLKTLDILVKLGWALLAGAFAMGVWVATIQIAVNENTSTTAAVQPRIRELELRESANNEKLANILKILDRIDQKLNQ
jgi:hypothetical protein